MVPNQIPNKVHQSFMSESVRSNWKDRRLQLLVATLECLGFEKLILSCPKPNQNFYMYAKFACLQPKFNWVDLESLLTILGSAQLLARLYELSDRQTVRDTHLVMHPDSPSGHGYSSRQESGMSRSCMILKTFLWKSS